MTEGEWNGCTDSFSMLRFLTGKGKASDHKLRLFACACCRRIWHLLTDERSRQAVDLVERFADKSVGTIEMHRAKLAAGLASGMPAHDWGWDKVALGDVSTPTHEGAARAAYLVTHMFSPFEGCPNTEAIPRDVAFAVAKETTQALIRDNADRAADGSAASLRAERSWQAAILRDIFGNPFRPPAPLSAPLLAWHGDAARRLAEAIYTERCFADLAVLADLLEEAGLTDGDLLGHLRGPGPHALGCWALDLILGKG
jgi:hypothetical protein